MTKTIKLRKIATNLLRAVSVFFLACGYFFGFSMVSILTIGLCTSEEFENLVSGQRFQSRYPLFNQHGQYYLQAEYVSMIGWMLLAAVLFIATG